MAGKLFPRGRALSRNSQQGEHDVYTMRRPHGTERFTVRLCGSVAIIAVVALGGCGSEDMPTFVGVEEQQAKEAEEQKNKAHAATIP